MRKTAVMIAALALVGCAPRYAAQQYNGNEIAGYYRNASTKVMTALECRNKYPIRQSATDHVRCLDSAKRKYGKRTPVMEPIEPGSSLLVNKHWKHYPGIMELQGGGSLTLEKWKEIQPLLPKSQQARDAIIDGLSRVSLEYDKFESAYRVGPDLHGPRYTINNHVALRGIIEPNKGSGFFLQFQYHDDDWLFVKRIRVNADGKNYEVAPFEVTRDHSTSVWEKALVHLSGKDKSTAQAIANGKDVTVRFVGSKYYHDFTVPEDMKSDLRAMLAAIEYL